MSSSKSASDTKQKALLIWNGMAAKQVSGGDMYIKKFVDYSGIDFDIVLSEQANELLDAPTGKRFITDGKMAQGTLALTSLYIRRAIKGWRMVKAAKPVGLDMVLASSPFLPDILPAIAAPAKHRAVILFHLIPKRKGASFRTKLRFFVARLEQKISLLIIGRYFDTILAGNVVVQEELQKRFPSKKIVIADAGMDTRVIDAAPSQKRDPNLGLFIGRLTTQKGILDLVDIVAAVTKEHPKFRLAVVGDGQDRNLFTDKIQQSGLTNIMLEGFVDEKRKYQLMKQATFFLFPSYEEGWGIALAEAMYAGAVAYCYELPHYRSIFADYPHYAPLGDKKAMGRDLINQYDVAVKSDQVEYFTRFDDRQVIKEVLAAITT